MGLRVGLKREKRNKKTITLILLLILVLGVLLLIFGRNSAVKYATENYGGDGLSVFYETLEKLNYPVSREKLSLSDEARENLVIIAGSDKFDIKNDKVKQWVAEGGKLLYLSENPIMTFIDYGDEQPVYGFEGMGVKYGQGEIIVVNVNDVRNDTLVDTTDKAYAIIKQIGGLEYKKISFDEIYLYDNPDEISLWKSMPLGIKLLLVEIVIAVVVYIFYRGKRFGKIVPFYEEVERSENEYLFSVSQIYREANCWDVAFDSYYRALVDSVKSEANGFVLIDSDNWLEYWRHMDIEEYDRAKLVYDFNKSKDNNRSKKQYVKMVSSIERLNEIVEKRRECKWKQLRAKK